MDSADLRSAAFEAVSLPYRDQWDLMGEQMKLLDFKFYLFYTYHQWLGPENDLRNMLGFVVTREEFEHNMSKGAKTPLAGKLTEQERQQLDLNMRVSALRLKKTPHDQIPLLQLFDRFELDDFEKNCVILAYAALLDDKYEKMCAYLQDDISKKHPTITLAVSLFMEEDGISQAYMARFQDGGAFAGLFDAEKRKEGFLTLAREPVSFLNGNLTLPLGYRLFDPEKAGESTGLLVQRNIGDALDSLYTLPGSVGLLSGRVGSGRTFQIEQLCRRRHERCLFVDLDLAGREPEEVARAAMLARLTDSVRCISGMEETTAEGDLAPPAPRLAEAVVKADLYRKRLYCCR